MADTFSPREDIKVLYVEDEADLRKHFGLFFGRRFTQYETAADGEEGLKKALEYRPDIIITDIQMPFMNGLEMLEALKEKTGGIPPTIVTSAFNESTYLHRAIDLGIHRYVLKPTKRKQLEEALEECIEIIDLRKSRKDQEEMLREIIDSQDSIVVLTDGKQLTHANKSFLTFFHYDTLEDFLKKHTCICDFFTRKDGCLDIVDTSRWLPQILEQPEPPFIAITNPEGIARVFLTKVSRHISSPSRYVITFTDVTLQYYYREELEKHVEEETAKRMAQESLLIQQGKQAVLGEMIGAIAHQWKQPLNIISLIASNPLNFWDDGDLTREDLLDHESRLLEQVQYMSKTMTTFRDFMKPAEQSYSFDLLDSLHEVFSLLDKLIHKAELTIQINLEDQTHGLELLEKRIRYAHPVLGNKNEFNQVVLNLIANTRDALQEKKIAPTTLTLSIYRHETTTQLIYEDEAGGIDSVMLDHFFEPYQTTKGDKGTGIGMYMSQMILEKMNATITVENTPKGARFTITLQNRGDTA